MKTGVFYFPTDYGMSAIELAKELEARGFDALFVCEHTHVPVSRKTPFPAGGELPKRYIHTHDPFVTLSFCAAATTNLVLGTGICLMSQRDPIVTAKAIASLDQMSGGRFVFGVGAGWNQDEMENHGQAYANRFKVMEERLNAMKVLWTEEEAEFHGQFVDFDKSWSWPKPAQKPYPPILLGGETDHTLNRVVRMADGWFPRPGRGFEPGESMAKLRAAAEKAGRDPKSIQVTVFRAPADAQQLEAYQQAGCDRVLLEIPDAPRDEILALLDDYQKLI